MLAREVPYTVIQKFLQERGLKLSTMTISRHKNKCLQNAKVVVARAITNKEARDRVANDSGGRTEAKRVERTIINANPAYAPTPAAQAKQRQWEKYLEELKEDADVLNELLWLMAVSKERVSRAIAEETNSGLILSTTNSAINGYSKLVYNFHDITSGMDNLQRLRYIQLVQLLNHILCNSDVSDRTRFELLQLLEDEKVKAEIRQQIQEQAENEQKTQESADLGS